MEYSDNLKTTEIPNQLLNLIIQGLNDAMDKTKKYAHMTKSETRSISIDNVNPVDLTSFMDSNNIPSDAYFNGTDNGYDGWYPYDLKLCWEVEVPTTEDERVSFRKKKFNTSLAFKSVYDLLIANGYVRSGFNSGLLKEFDDTSVYDMYMNKEYDRLVKYYSLSFKLKQV